MELGMYDVLVEWSNSLFDDFNLAVVGKEREAVPVSGAE